MFSPHSHLLEFDFLSPSKTANISQRDNAMQKLFMAVLYYVHIIQICSSNYHKNPKFFFLCATESSTVYRFLVDAHCTQRHSVHNSDLGHSS